MRGRRKLRLDEERTIVRTENIPLIELGAALAAGFH